MLWSSLTGLRVNDSSDLHDQEYVQNGLLLIGKGEFCLKLLCISLSNLTASLQSS